MNIQSISPDENGFLNFYKICTETLNKHAPRKRKTTRGNKSPFINKKISKTIMKRNELRNKFLKHKTDESRQAFVKQRNYCVSLLKKLRRNYYSSLDVKDITDNKAKIKSKSVVSITLKDNNKIVDSQNEVATIFNDCIFAPNSRMK